MRASLCLCMAMALGGAEKAIAAGFAVDVHGGRAVGMAAAVTAMIDDPSAAYYNPAGLVQGRGFNVQLGDTVILPLFKFEDLTGTKTDGSRNPIPPPHFYASYGISDDLSVGLGVFSPYGLVVEWPTDWTGRFLSQRSELVTFYINPEVAYQIEGRVRIGAGLQIVRSTVKLDRAINFVDSEGTATLAGGGWGFGGNVGIQVEAIPKLLSFGATYRSKVGVNVDGNAHFANIPVSLQTTLRDQRATTHADLPDQVSLGVAVWPLPNLHLAFNADYLSWQNIANISIKFPENEQLNIFQPKNWTHTWNYHLGAELFLTDAWTVRSGLMYDPTPSPQDTITPEIPDATRVNIALGGGYRWSNFRVDLGVQLVVITSIESRWPYLRGTYSGMAPLASLTLGAKL